ncbi:hypothetical protein SDRG_10326 [Saprolegnia diclina VS20]|uniref:Regulator of telomere elongation helicase 1 homolog n=1 Tax=Saprolegnia diclina (strain VS20) TaxID=1156394 RepID=T0QEW6_SAPDV|nr:hypothetical protein SDRG_10326 [Saprolegnia diclina VS20]EQC32130.1 hypothetical protein SDRG_10326 [Saprolegnia diclina VS20]|eukprot:XP_008614532.1 hypothetical protein SDRG_10326 [Saprolegnia diclina VS20]
MPTVHIAGVPVSFPFTPYESQLVYMEKVIMALETKQNALLESPTGTGKTLCLLCATLGWIAHRKKSLAKTSAKKKTEKLEYEDLPNDEGDANEDDDDVLPKIIYSSRTHTQLKQVVKELKQTAYKPKVAILGSREHLCVHPEISKMRGTQQNHSCRQAAKQLRCIFKSGYDQSKKGGNPRIMDIEELVTVNRERQICPFYASRDMLSKANVIFMPYNYLVDPPLRASLGVSLENAILIFDEAHNVESIASEAASYSLSTEDIQGCIKEAQECHRMIATSRYVPEESSFLSAQSVTTLMELLMEIERGLLSFPVSKDGGCTKPGEYIFDFFKAFNISFDTAPMVLGISEQVIEAITDGGNASNPRNSKLESLVSFLKTIFRDKDNHHKVTIRTQVTRRYQSGPTVTKTMRWFHYWCFHPGVAMQEIYDQKVHNIILTSGTLSPLDTTTKELGIPFPIQLENCHVVDASQVWLGVVGVGVTGKRLNSSYQYRSSVEYLVELGNTLINFARLVPNGLLIFFPSYTIMDQCVAHWQLKPANQQPCIWDRLLQLKTIHVEPKNRFEFADVVTAYHDDIKSSPQGAIFMAVCRGKVSEGIDFSNENGRAVVITGLPFAPIKDPKIVLKKEFLDQAIVPPGESKLTGNNWYVQQAARAVNQAIGRVIRHRHDYGAIILLDERFGYAQQRGTLSKWLQSYCHNFNSYGEAHGTLVRFFRYNKDKYATTPIPATVGKAPLPFNPPKRLEAPTPAPKVAVAPPPPKDVTANSQVAIGDGQSYVNPKLLTKPVKPPAPVLPAPSVKAPVASGTTSHAPSLRNVLEKQVVSASTATVRPASSSLESVVQNARAILSPQEMNELLSLIRNVPKAPEDMPEIAAMLGPYPELLDPIVALLPRSYQNFGAVSVNDAVQAMAKSAQRQKRKAASPVVAIPNPQCSICFDVLDMSHAAPCGHICCDRCWKKLESQGAIVCPVCKATWPIKSLVRIQAKTKVSKLNARAL